MKLEVRLVYFPISLILVPIGNCSAQDGIQMIEPSVIL